MVNFSFVFRAIKHGASSLRLILVDIGTERGYHIDGALQRIAARLGGLLTVVVDIPDDGVDIAQFGILRILAGHVPHLLCGLRADGDVLARRFVSGDDLQRERLVVAWLDMQELIRELLVGLEGVRDIRQVRTFTDSRSSNRINALLRLDDVGVGILGDRIGLSLVLPMKVDHVL